MWVLLNTGPVSVAAHRDDKEMLLVWARTRNHLEAAVGGDYRDKIVEMSDADYKFCVEIDRETWATRLGEITKAINYDNFKNSVDNPELSVVYHDVWGIFARKYGAYGKTGH